MYPEIPKRAARRARSERARSRKEASQQYRREVQRYKRMTVAELESLDYDELQDALLMCNDDEEAA